MPLSRLRRKQTHGSAKEGQRRSDADLYNAPEALLSYHGLDEVAIRLDRVLLQCGYNTKKRQRQCDQREPPRCPASAEEHKADCNAKRHHLPCGWDLVGDFGKSEERHQCT
jgi:hypothetical protein